MQNNLELAYFNSTNYPLSVKSQLEKLNYDDAQSVLLKYHQFLVKEFFIKNPNQRGLLICHGMGQGKTRLAVSISTAYREMDPYRNIIVLSAKSLAANFKKTVTEYTGKDDDYIDSNYTFISLNSSNMFKKITDIHKDIEEVMFEKKIENFVKDVNKKSSLENSMLIIDEAHNLFNSITNGSKNALSLYDLIMETKNIKILFLTGTPIINEPFELVPCFNMIRGSMIVEGGAEQETAQETEQETAQETEQDAEQETAQETEQDADQDADQETEQAAEQDADQAADQAAEQDADQETEQAAEQDAEQLHQNVKIANKTNKKPNRNVKNANKKRAIKEEIKELKSRKFGKKRNMITLFSEDTDEFDSYFIDYENKTIKNKDKFTNRIYGLSSYYGDLYFSSTKNKPGFPKELENIIEKVPMSQIQFARYMSARILEQEESKIAYKTSSSRFSSASGGSSTYRVKSRQISNYCIPEYALGPVRGYKTREKFINKIKIDDLQNVEEYSPKMYRIINNIEKHKDQLGIVYSQFVSGEGLAIFALILQALGYVKYGEPITVTEEDVGIDKKQSKQKIFAILSGDVDPEIRTEIINKFNSSDNKNGEQINILLLSGAVAEGIDLKRIRHVHIMEPFWNYARINQVKTRAIRYGSHVDMPENDRNVQVYIYLSDYPIGYPQSKIKELTTDNDLYIKSIDNMTIINTFIQAVAESSIDCSLHRPHIDEIIKEKINCKLCSPDNAQLFHPLLKTDMELPSNCRPFSEKKIQVEEIILPGNPEKFYYKNSNDKIKLYSFNKKLNGYAPLLRTHPLYADLTEAILLKE